MPDACISLRTGIRPRLTRTQRNHASTNLAAAPARSRAPRSGALHAPQSNDRTRQPTPPVETFDTSRSRCSPTNVASTPPRSPWRPSPTPRPAASPTTLHPTGGREPRALPRSHGHHPTSGLPFEDYAQRPPRPLFAVVPTQPKMGQAVAYPTQLPARPTRAERPVIEPRIVITTSTTHPSARRPIQSAARNRSTSRTGRPTHASSTLAHPQARKPMRAIREHPACTTPLRAHLVRNGDARHGRGRSHRASVRA